jgi:hypothetical protein
MPRRVTLEFGDLLQGLIEALLRIAPLYPVNGTVLLIVPHKGCVRHRRKSQGTQGADCGAEQPDSEHVPQTEAKILTRIPE